MDIEATEKEGMSNIMKYFDRIHDKLFTFNNILIAGYFALSQLVEGVSTSIIFIPLVNMVILILIDYRMMETSRFFSNIGKKTEAEIAKSQAKLDRTNLLSLLSIVTTLTVTIVFLFYLLGNSQENNDNTAENDQEISTVNDTTTIDSVDLRSIEVLDSNQIYMNREIDELTMFFGNENLRKDIMQTTKDTSDNLFVTDATYNHIRVTHIPTGKQAIGDSSDNIEENLLIALRKLKEELRTKTQQHLKGH